MFGRVAQEDRRSDISESSGTSTLIRDGVVSIKSGGSQFRKFTANVGRLGVAREAREAVRNVISTHNISLQISSTEPLDYEKFITEKAIQLENDPQRELVMFPRDDLEELVEAMPSRTVVPMVSENDITESAWLLTRDAVKNYIKPKHAIIFNYEKFSGDYDNLYEEQKDVDYLSSLVLESDMVLEEEKANSETSFTDIVKEGYVMLFKTDPGLLDNFKWAKKRYCTVKCLPSGEIGIGISKSRDCPPKHPYMTVHSTQLRSTRKGRTVLEIESSYSATQPRIFLLGFEEEEDLSSWFHLLQRAITVVSKDSISHTLQHQEDSDKMLSDADSCSTTGIDAWRGQKATTRALQPPIVERKNIFSLFHKLCPLPKPICEPCSVFNRCSILNTHIVNCCQNPVLRFLVAFIKLNLKLDVAPGVSQQIEPFYISIFFYDVSQGKRASEEFQLYRNETEEESDQDHKASDDLTKNFGVSREQLISRAANQVVFTTNRPLKDLWVVCRIDRMLSLDHSGDVYMKSSSDIKAVLKLQKLVQSSQSRLSEYRQRFAWAARPLHKTVSSEDTTASNSGNCVSMQIFRCENGRLTDLDIQKYLGDFTKMTRTGKFIIPNAGVEMKIEQIRSTEILEARVNSSLYALAPWKLPNDCCEPPVFELQAFDNVLPEPHSQFVNLLYVYPLSLKYDSQRIFSKARNILCSVRLVQGGNLSSAKVFFNRVHPSGPFVTSGKCAVQYHQQFPQFGDEIKIRLPLCLSSSDHLLFSFSHISVAEQTNGKSNESVESAIGYSWLPLVWKKDQLVMENDEEEFALPVAVDLPSTYFLSGPFREVNSKDNSDIKWVDQRPLFRLRVRLVSSVFTSEPDLQNFFQAFGRLKCGNVVENATFPTIVTTSTPSTKCTVRSCSPLMSSCSSDEESLTIRSILACMEALVMIDIKKIIPYLYVFLSRLLELVAYASTEKLAVSTLRAVVYICHACEKSGHKCLLRDFVRHHFVTAQFGEGATHSAICRFFPSVIHLFQNNNDYNNLAMVACQSWFFFGVIIKSIAQTIICRSLIKSARKDRLPSDILLQISAYINTMVSLLISKHQEIPDESHAGMINIAFFLRCCLSLVDRGAVFKWINSILQRLDDCESKVMRCYKLDILVIICQHEHWLPLCLPVIIDTRNEIQKVANHSVCCEHFSSSGIGSRFLPRLLNQVFYSSIKDQQGPFGCSEEWFLSPTYACHHFPLGLLFKELYVCMREPRDCRRRPIVLLRNLLAKHSYDKRYADMNSQRRIAILYLPLIHFAMDYINELESVITDSGVVTSSAPFLRSSDGCKNTFPSSNFTLSERLNQEEVQDILISVLYVIHRVPKRILGALCVEAKQNSLPQFFRLLEVTLEAFRYREGILRTSSERRQSYLKSHGESGRHKVALSGEGHSNNEENGPLSIHFRSLQLLNMSQEVALIVLEVSLSLAHTFADRQMGSLILESQTFSKLFSIHLSLLEECWPESVRLHCFYALSLLINMFRVHLFEEGPLDELSNLIERVLVALASRISTVQHAAAALLHLVLRHGFDAVQAYLAGKEILRSVSTRETLASEYTFVEKLGRSGCQTTVALARLLGKKSMLSSDRLEKGLTILHNISECSVKKASTFDQAVMELVYQLRGVMSATVALNDAINDPIRLADLHIQLANSYRGSAALRSAWFEALAELHAADNYYAEAAVCYAHALAIILKELARRDDANVDWSLFKWISSSVAVEEGVIESSGHIQSAGFSLENLSKKMEQTAQALTLAERYEAIGPMYRLIIPLLEKMDNFKSLVGIYAELQQAYSRAAEVKASGKRHLGTYFRVRFIGENHLKHDHNTDWVYRESGLASLAEVSLRFREYYGQLIGHDRIHVESETETTLDPSIVYIFVTHVEPIIPEGCTSKHFLTHTNVSEFIYESTVYDEDFLNTDSENVLTNQALKKTIVKVDGSFPSYRRRLRVLSVNSSVFSPLEFACQKLESKADQINTVLSDISECHPLDVKGLQLLLQGAVMPTVNAGPLSYAEAFTQPEQRKRYGDKGVHDLESAFKKLMSACEKALQVNQTVVAADQQTYHEVLLASFEAMHERLSGFFGTSLRDVRCQGSGVEVGSPMHVLNSISGITKS